MLARHVLVALALLAAPATASASTITIGGSDVTVGTVYQSGAVDPGVLRVTADAPRAHGDVDFDISSLAPIRDSITSVYLSLTSASLSSSLPNSAYWVEVYDKRASEDRTTQGGEFQPASDVDTGSFAQMMFPGAPQLVDVTSAVRRDLGLDGGVARGVTGFHLRLWFEGWSQVVNFSTSGAGAPALVVDYAGATSPAVPEPASLALAGLAGLALLRREARRGA